MNDLRIDAKIYAFHYIFLYKSNLFVFKLRILRKNYSSNVVKKRKKLETMHVSNGRVNNEEEPGKVGYTGCK